MSNCIYTINEKKYSLPEFKAYLVNGGLDALYPEGKYPWAKGGINEKQENYGVSESENETTDSGWRNNALQRPQVISAKTSTVKTGITKVDSPQDALHVVSSFSDYAQEQMVALVLGANNKILQIVRHTAGLNDQSMVDPGVLAGTIHGIKGAKSVYFAHNHPSGKGTQSVQDKIITKKLTDLMEGTGIKVEGMLVTVTGNEGTFYDSNRSYLDDVNIVETQADRVKNVPVTERKLVSNGKLAEQSITDSNVAIKIANEIANHRTGILLLNTQYQPVSFTEMNPDDMRKLRTNKTGTGASLLLKEIHETNARAMMMVIPEDKVELSMSYYAKIAENINAFAEATSHTKMLDGIIGQDSLADKRIDFNRSSVFFSKAVADRKFLDHAQANAEIPELTEAAKKFKAGEITRKEWNEAVDKYKPVSEYTEIPEPASAERMDSALKPKQKTLINWAKDNLKNGDWVRSRLDIPAYLREIEGYVGGTWVVTLHEDNSKQKPISYQSTAIMNDVSFHITNENHALDIATYDKHKFPLATIVGKIENVSPEEAKKQADAALNNPSWVQVGMDPRRHSYFYTRKNRTPVVGGERAIQIGGLVLVKNPVYGAQESFLYSKQNQTKNPHTKTSLSKSITNTMDKMFGNGWAQRLFATGKFKIIDEIDALEIIGYDALYHKAWHGTPHKIDKFSNKKIGTGEGAQAFGYGLYFTDKKEIAQWYQDKLSNDMGVSAKIGLFGSKKAINYFSFNSNQVAQLFHENKDIDFLLSKAKEGLSYYETELKADIKYREENNYPKRAFTNPAERIIASFKKDVELLEKVKSAGGFNIKGSVYEVELAPTQDEYLDWDKPLNEQSDLVKKAIKSLFPSTFFGKETENSIGRDLYRWVGERKAADEFGKGDKGASGLLHSVGVRGVRYKAEGGKSEANNYVIFDENDINIEAKYSKDGDIIAFYNPADDTTYFVHDNISKDKPDSFLAGLMLHEIGVHALQLGKSNKEFKALLDRFEKLKDTNPKFKEAFARVPEGTNPDHVTEEALAYFLENNPSSTFAQKIIELFRQIVRKLTSNNAWANKLTEQELLNMATNALRSAPDSLIFYNAARKSENIKYEQLQERFYSALRKGFRDAPNKIFGNAQQIKLWLAGNSAKIDVKKDEIYWSGINDWLDMQTGKISKEDVLNYLDDYGVHVEDVMLGGIDQDSEKIQEWIKTNDALVHYDPADDMYYITINDQHTGDEYHTKADAERMLWQEAGEDISQYEEPVKHNTDQLTLPNGKDYQELVVTIPTTEQFNELDVVHFGDTGEGRQIAWLRMNTRQDNKGGNTLFLEELQSQRSQIGRDKGFFKPLSKLEKIKAQEKLDELKEKNKELHAKLKDLAKNENDAEFESVTKERESILSEMDVLNTAIYGPYEDKAPAAPFITDSNNKATNAYISLLLKKAISHAIDNNQNSVSWTTGEQQSDRYDLSNYVDHIVYNKHHNGDWNVFTGESNKLIDQVGGKPLNESEIESYLGKDIARKIIAGEGTTTEINSSYGKENWTKISNVELKVGGEWTKAMYGDKNGLNAQGKPSLIMQAAMDIAQKMGGEIGTLSLDIGKQPALIITPAMKDKILAEGMPLFNKTPRTKKPKPEGANAVTGDLNRVNKDVQDAVEEFISNRTKPEQERIRANLEKHKGTAWAAAAVKGMAYREMLYRAMEGRDITNLETNAIWGISGQKINKKGEKGLGRTKIVKAFKAYPKYGDAVIHSLIGSYDFVGGNRKAENDISTSFANCDPSVECAKHCYAAGSNARPDEIAKSEFTEFVLSKYPKETAKRMSALYNATDASRAGLSLRLNDKGDLSKAQVELVKNLNKIGISLQIFSKRPELLREISGQNLKMLSVDSSNMGVAEANPDLRLAVVITDDMTEDMLIPVHDRVSVYLPVNLKGRLITTQELKERFPRLYSSMRRETLCPVDGGSYSTKPDTSFVHITSGINKNAEEKVWTCTACDFYGAAGCFKGDRQTTQRNAVIQEQRIYATDIQKEWAIKKARIELQKQLDLLKELGDIDGELHEGIGKILTEGQSDLRINVNAETETGISESENETLGGNKKSGGRVKQDDRGIKFNRQSFIRSDLTNTPAFKNWFGNSKVVDAEGNPLVVYHGTKADFNTFDLNKTGLNGLAIGHGFYFADSKLVASGYGDKSLAVYLKADNPTLSVTKRTITKAQVSNIIEDMEKEDEYFLSNYGDIDYEGRHAVLNAALEDIYTHSKNDAEIIGAIINVGGVGRDSVMRSVIARTKKDGFIVDASIASHAANEGDKVYVVLTPTQIKSATNNTGAFNKENKDIRFSRQSPTQSAPQYNDWRDVAIDKADNYLKTNKVFNRLHLSVGTQQHKALKDKDFGRVFDASVAFENDTARFANESADYARSLLPETESLQDVLKEVAGQGFQRNKDAVKIADAIFQTTIDDKLMTENDLKTAGYTPEQRVMYKEFFDAVNHSLDELGKSEMTRVARSLKMTDAPLDMSIKNTANFYANQADDPNIGKVFIDKADKITELKNQGYAPLSRFGRYTVDIVNNTTGKREYFGMFESESDANEMAKAFKEEYPDSTISQGILSQKNWEMFKGVTPETMEAFARIMDVEQDKAFQLYLAQAINNRSAMKRLIHRKKIPGFAKDPQRILASFITSNAKTTSKNYNLGGLVKAISDIPKSKGDVIDEAVDLYSYVQNPSEAGSRVRGMLFAWYLGGSVASAFVNTTQTLTTTLPYLHQFGSTEKVAAELIKAMKLATKNASTISGDLGKALHLAEEEGITAPHELHMLYGESQRMSIAKHPMLRPLQKAWGSFFSLAEGYNRRVAFIAAYNLAKSNNETNPFKFASDAVNQTQFIYSKSSRPNWARGTIGSMVFTFKTFTINYIEFLSRLPAQERAIALGVLILMSGLSGLPGSDDADDILDTIGQYLGYNTNTKEWKEKIVRDMVGKDATNFALHGISSVLPFDIGSRLSVGNVIPGTAILKKSETDKTRDVMEFAGPAGGVLQKLVQAFEASQTRNTLLGKAQAVAHEAMPKAFSDAYQAMDMMQTGYYRDYKGKNVRKTDSIDATFKLLGFQPTSISEPRSHERMLQQDIALVKSIESDIADLWANGVYEKDQSKVKEAKESLENWNKKNPETPIKIKMNQILKRVKAMKQTSADRMLKTTPKELRNMAKEALSE